MKPPNTSPVNFRVGRFRLPPTFQLWPDMKQAADIGAPVAIPRPTPSRRTFPDLLAPAFPVTPPIPPTVVSGDLITATHENTVSTGINDLWIDLQWLAASAPVNPTTTKGDLIVNDGSALARVPLGVDAQVLTADSTRPLGLKWATPTATGAYVPTSRQVLAGAGMTGGGALTADVTLNANVTSVFGRTGAVVLTSADITAAGGVPATRSILAGTGLTGGGNLSADRTLAVVPLGASGISHAAGIAPDPGATAGVTRYLREDATWATPAVGGAQTPWTSDIEAANHNLLHVSAITGPVNAELFLSGGGASANVTITQQTTVAQLTISSGSVLPSEAGAKANIITQFIAGANSATGMIFMGGNSGAAYPVQFLMGGAERMRIGINGFVGIGRDPVDYRLEVQGDLNITGLYRINGTPLSPGSGGQPQTPWTQHVNAAGYKLYGVAEIAVGGATLTGFAAVNIQTTGGGVVGMLQTDLTATGTPGFVLRNDTNFAAGVVFGGTGASAVGLRNVLSLYSQSGSNTPIIIAPNEIEKVRVTPAGTVGIGKLPTYMLDVAGDCNITGQFMVNGTPLAAGVKSVFARTGIVIAAVGDYTAAQVTNAVSTIGSYADPAWLTALAWSKVTGAPSISSYQTPWLSNIDGGGFTLKNATAIGVGGAAAPQAAIDSAGLIRINGLGAVPAAGAGGVGVELFANAGLGYVQAYNRTTSATAPLILQAGPLLLNPYVGSVGIGTDSPIYTLHVSSPNAYTEVMVWAPSGVANTGYIMRDSVRAWKIGVNLASVASGAFNIADATAGLSRFLIDTNGNVGIGTASPTTLVELSAAGQSSLGFQSTAGTAGIKRGAIIYDGGQSVTGGGWIFQQRTDAGVYAANLVTISQQYARIGIGVLNPAFALDCNGSMQFQGQLIGNNKAIISTSDAYLRINQLSESTSGIWLGTSYVRMQQGHLILGSGGGPGCVDIYADVADAVNRITINGNANANSWFNTGGKVGIGTTAPRGLLSLITANPSDIGTANQLTIGEQTNNSAYGLNFGYFYDAGLSTFKAVIQAYNAPLLINPIGSGKVGIRCQNPSGWLSVIAGASQSISTVSQLVLGEQSNNTAYQLRIGYVDLGAEYCGVIQTYVNNAGGTLHLNPMGGRVAIGLGASGVPSWTLQMGVDDAVKTASSTWGVSSDERTKRNVKPLCGGLEVIRQLRPIEAEFNGLGGTREGERVVSFLAQEVRDVLPHTVTSHRGALRAGEEETDLLTFNLHEVLIHMVLAIQQLSDRIVQLEQRA